MFIRVEFDNEFGKLLTNLRERRNLTQTQLAYLSGVHKSQIGAYERGKSPPSMPAFLKLMKFFGYTVVLEKKGKKNG